MHLPTLADRVPRRRSEWQPGRTQSVRPGFLIVWWSHLLPLPAVEQSNKLVKYYETKYIKSKYRYRYFSWNFRCFSLQPHLAESCRALFLLTTWNALVLRSSWLVGHFIIIYKTVLVFRGKWEQTKDRQQTNCKHNHLEYWKETPRWFYCPWSHYVFFAVFQELEHNILILKTHCLNQWLLCCWV